MDLTAAELTELPNILALARMNIGAQLAQGVKDENGRASTLLNAIGGIEEKLSKSQAETPPAKRKRGNGSNRV